MNITYKEKRGEAFNLNLDTQKNHENIVQIENQMKKAAMYIK